MTSTSNEGGGSFHTLRDHDLPIFDKRLHCYDRGWPHPPAEPAKEKGRSGPGGQSAFSISGTTRTKTADLWNGGGR